MPLPFAAAGAAKVALAVAPHLFGRGSRPNVGPAVRRFLSSRPSYNLSPEELALSERRRGRANELIGQGIQQARENVGRRFRARGLGGPAEEQALADVEQQGTVGRVNASRDVADLEEQMRQKGLDFERNKLVTAFGAEIGDLGLRQRNYDAGQAAFWNSQAELLPALFNVPSTTRAGLSSGAMGSAVPGAIGGPQRPEQLQY